MYIYQYQKMDVLSFLVLFLSTKGLTFFIIITRRRHSICVHHLPDPSGNRDLPMWRPGGSDPVIYNNRERKEWGRGGGLIQALVEYGGWVSGEGWWGGPFSSNPGAYQ